MLSLEFLFTIYLHLTIVRYIMAEQNDTKTNKVSKTLGGLAGKMLKLAQTGAKKLEDYAEKSAKENNNENAKKLAGFMNKVSQNLETKQDAYVAGVEKNTEELIKAGKKTFGKMKQMIGEMKTRAEVAKEKAVQDAESKEKKVAEAPEEPAKKAPAKEAPAEEAPAPAEEASTEETKDA